VNALDFAEDLRIHRASEASAAQTPVEHFSARAARLVRKGVELGEVVFSDSKGHSAGLGPSSPDFIA